MIYDIYDQEWIVPVKNWRERLAQILAKKNPVPSKSDKLCASSWGRCAVGKMHEQYPEVVRYKENDVQIRLASGDLVTSIGRPIDSELYHLGSRFCSAIEAENLKWAESILDEIEDRVLELKRETAQELVKKK